MAAAGDVCAGLIRHRVLLLRELCDTNILDVLVKKGFFNLGELELITGAADSDKCNYFVEIVSKQSGSKLSDLCSVLEKECPKLYKELMNDRHRFILNVSKCLEIMKEKLSKDKAIDEVQNQKLSIHATAKKYSIPTTTLFDKIKENHVLNVGRPQAIPLAEELKLAEGLRAMEKWGFGLSRNETLELVAEYVGKNNIVTPFSNNKPGPDWFINFRKRHQLSIKKPQPVEYARKKMTDPFVIYEYFEMLEKTLGELNLYDRPDLIWNLDETSLCLDPTKTKVVGAINQASTRTTFGSAKENITVLAAVSASGQKTSPLIIFKGKYVWNQWMADTENYDFKLAYAASTKGWMEGPIFLNYLKKILFPAFGEERPILVIFDGHSTHVTLDVIKLAIRHGITILKLPPHTSHLLQPLDVSVFRSFKCKWDAKLVTWQRHNVGIKLPKNVFAQTFADTWQETSPDIIKNGFRKTGIYPFDAHVVPEHKFDTVALKRYKEKQCTKALETPKSLKEMCLHVLNVNLHLTNSAFGSAEQSSRSQQDVYSGSGLNSISQGNLNQHVAVIGSDLDSEEQSSCNQLHANYGSALDSAGQNTFNQQVFASGSTLKSEQQRRLNKKVADSRPLKYGALTVLSRSCEQNKRFIAHEPTGVPECLQLEAKEKSDEASKIQILSDKKVTIVNSTKICFEELLLDKIKQDKKDINYGRKKTRVAKGAEVITLAKVLEEREKQLQESTSKRLLKEKVKNIKKEKKEQKTVKKKGKNEKNKVKKQKTKLKVSDSSSESNESIELNDESDYENIEEFRKQMSVSDSEIDEVDNVNISEEVSGELELNTRCKYPRVDNWLLVKFATKKTIKYYVGVVTEINSDQNPVVQYLRKVKRCDNREVFSYPYVEDISELRHHEDIVLFFPEPIKERRGLIRFEGISFSNFNIQ